MSEIVKVQIPAERYDGIIQNALTGMGDPGFDKTMGFQVAFNQRRLAQAELEYLYENNWIIRNVVDLYPVEATRRWVEITMGGKDSDRKRIEEFDQYQNALGLRETVKKACKWARLYGGAAIVQIMEDGRPMHEPVNFKNIRTIRKYIVLDRYKIRPYLLADTDPENPDFYELVLPPRIARAMRKELGQEDWINAGALIHHSRVIPFHGIELPPDVLERREGWGGSIIDSIFDTFTRYESSNTSVSNLLEEASLFIYAMHGLRDLLDAADEKAVSVLMTRLRTLRQAKSNLKMLVLDAEKEELKSVERRFNGIPEIMDRMMGQIVGASDIPMTILFGRGATGLNAQGTGESENEVWAKRVAQFQSDHIHPKLRQQDATGMFDMIWLAKDGPTRGKMPDEWDFKFWPIEDESESDQLNMREKQSNIDRTYKDLGVLLPEEIRASRFQGTDFSFETELDEKLFKEKQEESDFGGFGDFGFGYEGDFGGEDQAVAGPGDEAAPANAEGEAAPPEEDPLTQDAMDALDPMKVVREIWVEDPRAKNGGYYRQAQHQDAEPCRWVMNWQGLQLNITHMPGDIRHGKPMRAMYGNIRGSYGKAEDGMAVDVYMGRNLSSERVFRVSQVKPEDKQLDEYKWILGTDSIDEAREVYLAHMPVRYLGLIEEKSLDDLTEHRRDAATMGQFPGELEFQEKEVDRDDIIEQDPKTKEWVLWNRDRTKELGRHPSKEKAQAQETAINISKAKAKKKDSSDERVTKNQVGYQSRSATRQCQDCSHYENGRCDVVRGRVARQGTCDRWAEKRPFQPSRSNPAPSSPTAGGSR